MLNYIHYFIALTALFLSAQSYASAQVCSAKGPSAGMVSWIDQIKDEECRRTTIELLHTYVDENGQPLHGRYREDLYTMVAGIMQLLCLSSNTERPPETFDSYARESFLDGKQTRGMVYAESPTLMCTLSGRIIAASMGEQEFVDGWTPITIPTPWAPLQWLLGGESRDYAMSVIYEPAEGESSTELVSRTTSCAEWEFTGRSWIRMTPGGFSGNLVTGFGPPKISREISYKLCCDGSWVIRANGSFFPSHRVYIGDRAVTERLQTDLVRFIRTPKLKIADRVPLGAWSGRNPPICQQ